jgi:ABC-type transporter Mla subunit MlaD
MSHPDQLDALNNKPEPLRASLQETIREVERLNSEFVQRRAVGEVIADLARILDHMAEQAEDTLGEAGDRD